MAYNTECAAAGIFCPRVPRFSDPSDTWTYRTFPWGAHSAPLGKTDVSNNNRVIDETSELVKDYR
jgi:hypothetical protein